jgi:hypothetical protein
MYSKYDALFLSRYTVRLTVKRTLLQLTGRLSELTNYITPKCTEEPKEYYGHNRIRKLPCKLTLVSLELIVCVGVKHFSDVKRGTNKYATVKISKLIFCYSYFVLWTRFKFLPTFELGYRVEEMLHSPTNFHCYWRIYSLKSADTVGRAQESLRRLVICGTAARSWSCLFR